MNDLNIFTSNRMEILAEQLARIVREPLSSPLSPEVIVVQSKGMARWISMALAGHNGICANCFYPFPNTFLYEMYKIVISDLPDESPFDPSTMTFRIMKTLPECTQLPGFESLKQYLIDDDMGMKLFQISREIADLFDQYIVFRPEMVFNWENGNEHHWQAHLWRKLSSGVKHLHRAGIRKTFLEKLRNSPHQLDNLPKRVSIFGISYLPLFHLETIVEISKHTQVNFFVMNPCKEYWGDIVSDRETRKFKKKYAARSNDTESDLYLEQGNRLLASMGGLGRNFFSMISDLTCHIVELFDENQDVTILGKIQSDILHLIDRQKYPPQSALNAAPTAFSSPSIVTHSSISDIDSSIRIHACHSPMREIEVLHDNLLAMIEENVDLLPKDIVVMTPDIDLYAPLIHAVFGGQIDEKMRIPYTIADQRIIKESRIVEGFMSILNLKGSRMGVNSVMAMFELPGIKEKFGITESEIEIFEHWIDETHIRWGIDAEHRRHLDLPGFPENTWKAGIDRLLLGYAMPGFNRKLFAGILPYDHIEGGDAKTLGKLISFLDRLFKSVYSLNQARTLGEWNQILLEILQQFFAEDEESEPDIQMLRRILDKLSQKETLSGFDKVISIEVVTSFLESLFEHEQLLSGFISGGVTFCAMLPMRSIPFKVVCLVGMNSDDFPRETKTVEFDLMAKNPKIGDRSKRNDDKYLFLEALLSARKKFYISYVGQNIQDNTRIHPSVLVSELVDYIQEGFGLFEEQVVIFHRLQAFSPEYFKNNDKLFSYAYENFIAGFKIYEDRMAARFLTTKLPEPAKEFKNLTIQAVSAFFSNPVKYLLEKRLGIYLSEMTDLLDDSEHFRLDHLEKYILDQELMKTRRSGSNLKEFFRIKKASGELPHGKVGKCIYNEMSLDAEEFVRKINDHIQDDRFEDREVELDIADFRICDRITDGHEHGLVKIIYAKFKPKYLLNTWIYHLVLCKLLEDSRPVRSLLVCKDVAWEFATVFSAIDILKDLLEFYWKGMSEPLHFSPESSFEYADNILRKHRTPQEALTAGRKKWRGNEFSRGESRDPYYELCFGNDDPLDKDFEKISTNIFEPLLSHCSEIVL
jgi:exodeoxyribonuclease V gamma subunit